jgi:hypothetical protein
MSPDPAARAPPLGRPRGARVHKVAPREEWKRQAKHWAGVRATAVQELKQGRTWAQVADLLGVSEATAWNIAHPK